MVTFLYEEAKRESGVLWFSTRVVKAVGDIAQTLSESLY